VLKVVTSCGQGFNNVYYDLMVNATTMALVMAEKDPPVFRDFLGIGRKDESASKQVQPTAGFANRNNVGFEEDGEAETSARASSGNSGRFETPPAPGLLTPPFTVGFPTSSEAGSGDESVGILCGIPGVNVIQYVDGSVESLDTVWELLPSVSESRFCHLDSVKSIASSYW
jgi:hypothetical protein